VRAVVGVIDDDEPPPAMLSLAWNCQRWNTTPDPGGMYDQDYQTMRLMGVCLNIYNAVSHLRNCRGAQIHSLSESERKILGWLVKQGLVFYA